MKRRSVDVPDTPVVSGFYFYKGLDSFEKVSIM